MSFKSIVSAIGGFFKGLFTPEQQTQLATNITEFVSTDIGKLAVDAVSYVSVALPTASNVEKRDAAVAKLKADALEAKKDLSGIAGSLFNLFVEMALQYVIAKGLPAILASIHAGEAQEDEPEAAPAA